MVGLLDPRIADDLMRIVRLPGRRGSARSTIRAATSATGPRPAAAAIRRGRSGIGPTLLPQAVTDDRAELGEPGRRIGPAHEVVGDPGVEQADHRADRLAAGGPRHPPLPPTTSEHAPDPRDIEPQVARSNAAPVLRIGVGRGGRVARGAIQQEIREARREIDAGTDCQRE